MEITAKYRGFTLLELLTVLALTAVTTSIAAPNLKNLSSSRQNASYQLASYAKSVRVKAFASTSAYKFLPVSSGTLQAWRAATCDATSFTKDASLSWSLPEGVTFSDTGWSVCYNARGFSSSTVVIQLSDGDKRGAQVEIMLGGAAKLK